MFDAQSWTPLTFYANTTEGGLNKQIWRQLNRYGNHKYDITEVFVDRFMPCQLNRLLTIDSLVSIKLCYPNDLGDPTDLTFCYKKDAAGVVIDLIALSIIDTSTAEILYKTNAGGIDYILILGNVLFDNGVGGTWNIPHGVYFWEIKDSSNTWYSDLFYSNGITLGTRSEGISQNDLYDMESDNELNLT